jgi:hypothetical protein
LLSARVTSGKFCRRLPPPSASQGSLGVGVKGGSVGGKGGGSRLIPRPPLEWIELPVIRFPWWPSAVKATPKR